jgi:FkbM family methyltransferase
MRAGFSKRISDILNRIFAICTKPLLGRGIGQRFHIVGKVYAHLYRYLNPGTVIQFTIPEGKLHVVSNSAMARELAKVTSYEEGTTKLYRRIVKEGMVILDIGANIGYYSIIGSRLVGIKGKVFAFEPGPEAFALLVKNIEVNGYTNVIPVQKAVSAEKGKATLFLSEDSLTNSLHGDGLMGSVEVDVTSIDEFIKSVNSPVNLAKIDVEGEEINVLEGMKKTIAENPDLKILAELSKGWVKKVGLSIPGFLEKVRNYGLKP